MMLADGFRIEVAARPALIAQILADLHAICFAGSPQETWSVQAISTLLNTPLTIGLIALGPADKIAGFIIGRAVADEGEVLTLCVSPAVRRRGIATALIGALEEQLAPGRGILLEVATTNQAARELYEFLGFHEIGRRPAYYKRGGQAVDALVLSSDKGR